MVVHDRMYSNEEDIIDFILFSIGDVTRFADRSRELWSERTMSDTQYKQNS